MAKGWILGLTLAGLLAAGCSPTPAPAGGAATTGGSASSGASGKKIKIGVSIPAADHGWTAGVNYWAQEASKLYPDVEWIISPAQTPEKQIADMETMLTKGVDGMVVLATESAPITPAAKKVHERGVFLVNVDRGFLEPVADVFLEGDNKAFGRKSAEYMVQKMNGQGKVLILRGIPCTVDTDRYNAAMEVFKASPGIQVLDAQSGMWNKQKAQEVTQTLLLKHPEVDAIWASDDDMALGAELALKEAGRADKVWMLGGAGMKDVVKRVMDGDKMFPADITYPPSMIATGMSIAVSALNGGNLDKKRPFLPRHLMLDVELVTPDNAKNYYFPDSVY
ncbi:MAG: ABC transporter substrate-binding protein [Armatimonadetes bacterium]|nr:ABC transporter substrate-binding protein [Armatimonadota bacterium]